MIKQWPAVAEKEAKSKPSLPMVWRLRGIEDFLTSSDQPEAIKALSQDLWQRPVYVRYSVIQALTGVQTPRASALPAIEEALVSALDDTEEVKSLGMAMNGRNYSSPRICDLAAHGLAERWPERFHFDMSGSLETRERQRIQCINVWRAAHRLPPL